MQRPPGPPSGPYGSPGGAPPGPMANGPASGGMMRPLGPPGPIGSAVPSYGPAQAAAGMQQMSLSGPPGPPAGLGGPPPPAGISSGSHGDSGLGARPPGLFGAPRPMGPPSSGPGSGGFIGGQPPGPGGFPRGPPSSGAAGGPPPPAAGVPGPGPYSAGAAGLPGPRPPGAPLANGSAAAGGAHSGPLPYHQQQPVAAPGPGVLGPGLRPPGSYMSAGGPPSGGATTAAVPGSGPGSGGAVRPAMPGFMPAGPPGMPRPVGPGSMGGPAGMPGIPGPPAFGATPPGPPGPPGAGVGVGGPPGMLQPPAVPGMPGMRPPPSGMPGPGVPGPGAPGGFGPPQPAAMQHAGPGMPGAAPGRQAMAARIDPAQIPRPMVNQSQEVQMFETRVNGQHVNPPSSTTRFIVRDMGDANPRLMRSSLNAVPATNDMLNNSGMQFALTVQPLALLDPAEDQTQVVDLGELGPVRCGRCKAYMNPYMRWTDGGKAFVCNFCSHTNACPDPYFSYLGSDGRRRDTYERSELCRGSYDVLATKEYFVRPPMPVTHLFLIDVSSTAVASGATAATCLCIEQVLDSLLGGDSTMVGIVTYDSSVHFFNVAKGQAMPQMLVMPDVNDVYAPMSSQLLAKLSDCREQLQELLGSIPTMFAAVAGPECCGTAAVEACVELLKPTGGKIHVFMSSLPNCGTKALKLRDGQSNVSDKEKQTGLLPQDMTYLTLAAQAADFNVCIDLFLLAQHYVDVATLSTLTHTTGGTLYHYLPFNPLMDQDQLLNDLKWNVSRQQGLEAILRVRCSAGLDVEGYLGDFYKPPNSPTDLYLAAIDCDKAIVAKLAIVEKLNPNTEVYLQCALLYTTTNGSRVVRISTLALPVSDQMGAVFKGADLDCQVAVMTRQVAATIPGGTSAAAKELIMSRITATLSAYRKYCATSSSSVQLILPEALKLLPLFSLALHKSPILRPDVRPDERSLWLAHMMGSSCGRVMGLLHPRLFAVHQLLRAGSMPADGALPEPLILSSEMLDEGGVYLLDSGADLLLYVDQSVNDQIVQDLLGMPNVSTLFQTPQPLPLTPQDTPASRLLFELLTAVRLNRCAFMRLRVAKKGDQTYSQFINLLVEDKSTAGMSYVEFLCHVHRQIQEKMG